jgi:hypothetical protein
VAGLGTIPREWFESRIIGVGRVTGSYADLYSPEWIAYLRPKVQPLCVELGLPDFDLSILMQAEKRIITQTVSSYVKDLDSFAGIYYASRYGLGLRTGHSLNTMRFFIRCRIDRSRLVRNLRKPLSF